MVSGGFRLFFVLVSTLEQNVEKYAFQEMLMIKDNNIMKKPFKIKFKWVVALISESSTLDVLSRKVFLKLTVQ